MMRRAIGVLTGVLLGAAAPLGWAQGGEATIRLEVDATDLPRNLLRSQMTIPVKPGPVNLRYVLWTPGNHAPSGPIQNVVDLRISDCSGAALPWERDAEAATRLSVTAPDGCDQITVSMAYIAGQPSVTSRSTDSYGLPTHGVLNWNTVLFYPEGRSHQDVAVAASLGLPPEWKWGTSLVERAGGGRERLMEQGAREIRWIDFDKVTLATLVDSPVVMGRHLECREMEIGVVPGVEGSPRHAYCVVGPDASSIDVPEWLETSIDAMVREAIALFAPLGFPRERYVFLHALGAGLDFGVEHARSTLICDAPSIYRDARREGERLGGAGLGVVPHEYFHAWGGKLVTPAGLARENFHTPVTTELLWVYEGLTSYYTNILSVRGGMTSFAEYLHSWAMSAATYERRSGRLWRSVADTARAAALLRDRGRFWYEARQGQEYYGQGALFWLEADALIRRGTSGARSLDDFCRALLAAPPVQPVGRPATYTRGDIVNVLEGVYSGVDWDQLIRERIESPQPSLDLSPLLRLAGYRLVMAAEPSALQKKSATEADFKMSLGVRLNKEGEIIDLVPGSPADEARLAYGMKILGVNRLVYTVERLRDVVRQTTESGGFDLTLTWGERIETRRVAYDGGDRWPRLERIDGEPDIFRAIATPLLAEDGAAN